MTKHLTLGAGALAAVALLAGSAAGTGDRRLVGLSQRR